MNKNRTNGGDWMNQEVQSGIAGDKTKDRIGEKLPTTEDQNSPRSQS